MISVCDGLDLDARAGGFCCGRRGWCYWDLVDGVAVGGGGFCAEELDVCWGNVFAVERGFEIGECCGPVFGFRHGFFNGEKKEDVNDVILY